MCASIYVCVCTYIHTHLHGMTQMVKTAPAMWKIWVQYLGGEDNLEEGMATHYSILAWRIPMDRGAWKSTVQRGHKESDA